ncbi:MAG: hypothetical protein GX605_14290, partial [Chloroflexi bacterium]|nr:hypothetical protein [Chloroflexota bacterium]
MERTDLEAGRLLGQEEGAAPLAALLALARALPEYETLRRQLQAGQAMDQAEPLVRPARAFLLAALQRDLGRPILVVTPRPEGARRMADEIAAWSETPEAVFLFPEPGILPFERAPWPLESRQQRLAALAALSNRELKSPPLVVASARALLHRTLPAREMRLRLRTLRLGQKVSLTETLERWVAFGYRPVEVVEEPGAFSRRGGIVDCFPPNLRFPVRIEFFGNQVDSLRLFDPSTQRTRERIPEAVIGPATEALPPYGPQAVKRMAGLDFGRCHPLAESQFRSDKEMLEQATVFNGIELFLPYLYSSSSSALEHLPAEGVLVLENPAEVQTALAEALSHAEELRRELVSAGDLPDGFNSPYADASQFMETLRTRRQLLLSSAEEQPSPGQLAFRFGHADRYGGQLKRVSETVQRLQEQGDRVVILSRQAPRLLELFGEAGLPVAQAFGGLGLPPPGSVTVLQRLLEEGWVLELDHGGSDALYLLTDAEIFGWAKPKPRRTRVSHAIAPESFFADLTPGDYVVHMEHGIGHFLGLATMNLDGVEKEYILLEYAAGDRLYVPVHQADRLTRYVGLSEEAPNLHRLGTAEWDQVKARTRRAVADIAQELLDLYARRSVVHGHAFGPDTPWQEELEAAFPYVETEDQLHAIEAVKGDMEQAMPMDRLICGDVG